LLYLNPVEDSVAVHSSDPVRTAPKDPELNMGCFFNSANSSLFSFIEVIFILFLVEMWLDQHIRMVLEKQEHHYRYTADDATTTTLPKRLYLTSLFLIFGFTHSISPNSLNLA
jgi:hypothetical protein